MYPLPKYETRQQIANDLQAAQSGFEAGQIGNITQCTELLGELYKFDYRQHLDADFVGPLRPGTELPMPGRGAPLTSAMMKRYQEI